MALETLRAVRILRELTDSELESFASLLTVREPKKGEQILKEGGPVTHLYIVFDGVVHVRRIARTKEMLMGRLGVGSFFGEINLFDPGTATASIYAMSTPTRLAMVDYDTLRNFLSSNPAVGYKICSAMMTEMSQRLRTTSSRLVNSVYWTSNEAAKPA